ncbi:MAG: type II CRISPR RNA-guided endonuclease Cas9, partial [Bullifex sp.]
SFSFGDLSAFQEAFRIKRASERKEKMSSICSCTDKKIGDGIIKLINGNKVGVRNLFTVDEDSELFKESVCFRDADFEDVKLPALEALLNDDDRTMLLVSLKAIYDYIILADILDGCSSVSEGKVKQYEENRKDLASFKYLIRKYLSKQEYEEYFHSEKVGSYSSYIGVIQDNRTGKKTIRRCSYDDFRKCTASIVKKIKAEECDNSLVKDITDKLETDSFLPLLISSRNSVIPYQLHKMELEAILTNASCYLPFLNEKDESGYSVKEKIIMLQTFRIPYYVGPITNSHSTDEQKKYSWLVRREDGKVYPWNFEEKIDLAASAENFITKMKSHCTYLTDYLVIPKNSLLYSKFMVLNEINKLTINGQPITVKQKQDIFDDLYRRNRKVTSKMIRDYAVARGWASKPVTLGGIDGEPKSSLASYYDFRDIIELKRLEYSKVEEIIEKITLFGDDRSLCLKAVREIAGDALDEEEIKDIANRRYAGWGRLSREFLVGLEAESSRTGEITSIISLLWNTNSNLMEIINDPEYRIVEKLKGKSIDKLDYSVVEELYVSPSVKRQIWQTLKICQELEKIMKRAPAKVFVEVARGDSENSGRTKSRKQALEELYAGIRKEGLFKEEIDELSASLEKYSEQDISRQDKLYLYFTQMGRCMYSGERIDIESLYDTNVYDIDHIYPQSLTADDSLNNRVLTLKKYNGQKSDSFPIPDEWRTKMAGHWKMLLSRELISKDKYKRLTRSTPLTDDELQGFINRQLVEVSQTTKATIDILKRYYGESTSVVYSKARNVSYFRQRFSIPKARSLNDLHHAKDAYLNIVVGNTYMTKFTSNYWRYISDSKASSEANTSSGMPRWKYNLMKMFDWTVEGAWYPGLTGTIVTVKKECWNDDVRLTKKVNEKKGKIFDLQLVKGAKSEGLIPAKKVSDEGISDSEWTKKYGGYNKQAVSYFIIAEHKGKKGRDISIFPAYCASKDHLKTISDIEQYLIRQHQIAEPRVIVPKLKINDLIEYKGMRMRIVARTGKYIKISYEVSL